MKNNIKLFFRSLISNNATIDGGRTKPWYAAIIMFFISIILALVPTFVSNIKINGDDIYKTNNYGFAEATVKFEQDLVERNVTFEVANSPVDESKQLIASDTSYTYMYKSGIDDSNPEGVNTIMFEYFPGEMQTKISEMENEVYSHVVFGFNDMYIRVVNVNTGESMGSIYCMNAYKKFETGYKLNSLYEVSDGTAEGIEKTFNNWKGFCRTAYHDTKFINLGRQCAVSAAIDAVIILLMGFMVWVLTRGKSNVYRPVFNLWNSQKVVYWASITPAILTCGFGFLLTNLMSALFPLLLGIRVMWLSMKSLRPDGSGYAAQ